MRIRTNKNIRRRRAVVGDIGMAYLIKEATSARQTIIFIHGFPFNKNMWIKQLESLPADVTGIALDVRGHGSSTAGHGFFSVDVFARDLLAFMDTLQIRQATICGVSMGGYIALRAHEIAPERFEGLILSDTNSLADDDAGKIKRFETIQSVLKHGTRVFAISFAERVFSVQSLANSQDAVELIKSSIRRNNVRSICATLLALASRTETTDHLKNISIPTLLIWGAEDQVTPKKQAEILKLHIKGARYVEFPDCGHLPNLENSQGFNQVILDFLSE